MQHFTEILIQNNGVMLSAMTAAPDSVIKSVFGPARTTQVFEFAAAMDANESRRIIPHGHHSPVDAYLVIGNRRSRITGRNITKNWRFKTEGQALDKMGKLARSGWSVAMAPILIGLVASTMEPLK